MTNDHYFLKGPMRYLEEKLGPWSWATDVQYCDASQPVHIYSQEKLRNWRKDVNGARS